jgi:hypothetical protein
MTDNRQLAQENKPQPISTAPHDRYVVLIGPSGYVTTPHRYVVARHDAVHRPKQPWVNYANDSVLDDGPMPTHWMERISELPLEDFQEKM